MTSPMSLNLNLESPDAVCLVSVELLLCRHLDLFYLHVGVRYLLGGGS